MSTVYRSYLRELEGASAIGVYILLGTAMKDLNTAEYNMLCKHVKD